MKSGFVILTSAISENPFLPRPVRLSQAFESSSGGISRRSFLKRTGGATVATLVVWNMAANDARAEVTNADGSGSGSGSFRYKIKCVAWPDPAHNQQYNYISSTEWYITNIFLSGAVNDEIKNEFSITINASGIHRWVPLFSTSSTSEAVQETMIITVWREGRNIRYSLLSGDGQSINGDLTLIISSVPGIEAKAYLLEDTWSIQQGSIGWNQAEGASAQIDFAPATKIRGSVGLGCAFTIVKVDQNGHEISE